MSALEQLPQRSRVLVIRLRSLGDCVLTTPAIQLLKSFRPDLEVGVAVEERFSAVFENSPDIAAILEPTVKAAAFFRPALCINLHGGTRSLGMTLASGARLRAGFAHHRASGIYNVRIPRAQEILEEERTVHTVEHLASAMFYLGVPRAAIPRARIFAQPPGAARPYAIIHPVAAQPEKTWSAQGFLSVAGRLENLEPVFIAGAGEDLTPFAKYRCIAGAPLAEIKALIAGASLFIGNDSGPAHMAAAFGIPVVVLFGSSDPVIWAPWRTQSQVIARRPITSISPGEVYNAVQYLQVAQ
jgi:heptosyltransferase III